VIVQADTAGIAEAARRLRAGDIVAFPTETVYGLGADATSDRAVARVFAAKERPDFNPLIVHVRDAAQARRYTRWSDLAERLARRFWPGPLTFVLPRSPECPVSLLVSAGLDSVAVRAPAHPVAQAILAAAGVPIAAPSANRSGAISPTTAAHVAVSLGERVPLIVDGGPTWVGLESTVLDVGGAEPVLLRPGGLAVESIEAELGCKVESIGNSARPASPGMLERHYAPNARLRLNARAAEAGEVLLGFGPDAPPDAANLSPSGDLEEAAANLFALLHRLDASDARLIAVMSIPERGLGRAINDRLRRAARRP
jgi:L-threonylcarbamoyladenylate synthase